MSVGFLEKGGYVTLETGRLARLTPKGLDAREAYRLRLAHMEERWTARFGEEAIGNLRHFLERLVGDGTAQQSPLFKGLEPHPGGWRASVRKPETLPHHPMVLHRGGFPDGA
jgi:hypothetical protein